MIHGIIGDTNAGIGDTENRIVILPQEADIQFAGLLAYYAGAEKLSVGDWIEITAKVRCEYTDAYQEKGPVLYIRNLKKCEACKPEVATF